MSEIVRVRVAAVGGTATKLLDDGRRKAAQFFEVGVDEVRLVRISEAEPDLTTFHGDGTVQVVDWKAEAVFERRLSAFPTGGE